jgi:hypothetical protein
MPDKTLETRVRSNGLLFILYAVPSFTAWIYCLFGDPIGLIDVLGSCFSVRIRTDLTKAPLRPSASLAMYTLAIPAYIRYAIELRRSKYTDDPRFAWLIATGTAALLTLALYRRTAESVGRGATQLRYQGLMDLIERYQVAHDAFLFSLVLALSLCITFVVSRPFERARGQRRALMNIPLEKNAYKSRPGNAESRTNRSTGQP